MMLVEQEGKVKKTLKEVFGFDQFRGTQESIITNVLNREDTFVIMPTGAGKSLCYQLPALLNEGTAIVISPLIALMKNQVDQLNTLGVNAQFLNSTLTKGEMNRVKKGTLSGEVKLLYVAPESITKEDNVEFLKQAKISFVAIDCPNNVTSSAILIWPTKPTWPASVTRSPNFELPETPLCATNKQCSPIWTLCATITRSSAWPAGL